MGKNSNEKKSVRNNLDSNNASNRRKRRAERNRLRTIKHVHKLLDQIVDGVADGFNHQGWCNAATSLKQVSPFLTPDEHSAVGESWRMLYASDVSNTQLVRIVDKIKERVAGNLKDVL